MHWLSHTLVQMSKLEFTYTSDSITNLINVMEKHKENYIETLKATKVSTLNGDINLFNDVVSSLMKLKLDYSLPQKSKSKPKKI